MAEERYIEWLERMEIPVEDTTSIESLQSRLEEELLTPTDAQLDALWGAVGMKYEIMAPEGIHPTLVEFPWGEEVRFGVKGRRGLFGWSSVKEFLGR